MKRVSIFLIITFVLTWTVEFFMWQNGGLENPATQMLLAGVMMIPAFSVLLTKWFTKESFHLKSFRLEFKKYFRYYLIAWLGPFFLIIIGTALYFLIFRSNFDPELTLLRNSMQAAQTQQPIEITSQMLITTILIQSLISMIFAPILNIFPTLGEEIGWRGYLLPKLDLLMNRRMAVLITGAIWGIWHAPIIAMGHNYGKEYAGYPFWGILAMIIFCIFVGSFLSWLTFHVHNPVPAAIAHGALNGFASIGLIFIKNAPSVFVGPFPTGIIGGIGFVIVGIWCWLKIDKAGVEKAADTEIDSSMA